jgi:hypothetical protein
LPPDAPLAILTAEERRTMTEVMTMPQSGSLTVQPSAVGAIKRALNRSGWFDQDVIAAGELRQGKSPTVLGMVTGKAVIDLFRRHTKSLPRHFVLAVLPDRIAVLKVTTAVSDVENGPYTIKIKQGECGSLRRAAVRLLDLADGPRSTDATLELDGRERIPVSRFNPNGDPDTDELIGILGDGVASLRALSDKQHRWREDEDDLRRAGAVRAAEDPELIDDAKRGKPDVDLSGWAERRGLDFRGGKPQSGYLTVTCPWSKDILFNVVRGHWPGGTYGVLCHEARLYDVDEVGNFHGIKVSSANSGAILDVIDSLSAIPIFWGGQVNYFKVPYTSAGARVPHVGRVTGLHVARRAERYTKSSAVWTELPLDHLGLQDHWIAAVRKNSDERTVDALLRGPVRDALASQQGLGFEIRIEYGQAIVSRQDFLARHEDLDALIATAEDVAKGVREICTAGDDRKSLRAELPTPSWLGSYRGGKLTTWPVGARQDMVVKVARERGLALEDVRTFHATFPSLNIPGEAFAVLRGRLPGTSLSGRILCCAERPMVLPDDFRKVLSDPGGAVGADVVLLEVDPSTPATAPEGEVIDGIRVAVADGVLTAWRGRPSWQIDGGALDQLAEVAAIVTARGLDRRAVSIL